MRSCNSPSGRRRLALIAASMLSIGVAPDASHAQLAKDTARAGRSTLFTPEDGWIAAGFAALAFVTYPNDRHLAVQSQRAGLQENMGLRRSAAVFRTLGEPGALIGGATAWAVGRLADRPQLAATGLRVTESIIVARVLTTAAKVVIGRARPATTNDRDPHDFRWWHGTRSDYTSMPSGHTSAAFAAASALAGEWPRFAPGSARYAVPALYAGATLVGLSRMYHDRHWGSDVVAGAALGTLVGRVVGRWGREHDGNRVQRWLAPVRLHASGGVGDDVRLSLVRAW